MTTVSFALEDVDELRVGIAPEQLIHGEENGWRTVAVAPGAVPSATVTFKPGTAGIDWPKEEG